MQCHMKNLFCTFISALLLIASQGLQNASYLVRGDDRRFTQSRLPVSYYNIAAALPRSTPEKENVSPQGIEDYLKAVQESKQDLHSVMLLRHGKVVFEKWFGDNA